MQCSGYVKQNQVDVLFESPSDSTGTISITMLRVVEAVGVFGQIGITDLPLYPTVHFAMSSVVQPVEQSVSTVMPILFSTAALSVAPESSVTPVALSVVPKRLVTRHQPLLLQHHINHLQYHNNKRFHHHTRLAEREFQPERIALEM